MMYHYRSSPICSTPDPIFNILCLLDIDVGGILAQCHQFREGVAYRSVSVNSQKWMNRPFYWRPVRFHWPCWEFSRGCCSLSKRLPRERDEENKPLCW